MKRRRECTREAADGELQVVTAARNLMLHVTAARSCACATAAVGTRMTLVCVEGVEQHRLCQCSSRQDKAEAKQGRRCYRGRPMTCADCSSSRKRWRSCSSKRATRHAPHFPSQTLHSPQTPALSCLRTMPSKIHFNFMMCIPVPNVGNACHPAIVGAVVGEHRCSALALTARPTPVVFHRSWLLSAVHNWAALLRGKGACNCT